ncbi:MAG: protein kinase [Elusimicrobia bacterium]|nr:protein kinase [Elusimicrobiota bacterium]
MRSLIRRYSPLLLPALMLLVFSGSDCGEQEQQQRRRAASAQQPRFSELPPPVRDVNRISTGLHDLGGGSNHVPAGSARGDSLSFVRRSLTPDPSPPPNSASLEASGAILAGSNAPQDRGYVAGQSIPEIIGVPVQNVKSGAYSLGRKLTGLVFADAKAAKETADGVRGEVREAKSKLADGPVAKRMNQIPEIRQSVEPSARAKKFIKEASSKSAVKDYGAALRAVDSAVQVDPESADAYALKSEVLNKLKRYQEAEQAAARAVKLDARNARAQQNLAWAQYKLGRFDASVASATSAISIRPNDAVNYAIRAYAEFQLGRRDQALDDLRMAAKLDPNFRGKYELALAGKNVVDTVEDDSSLLEQVLAVVGSWPKWSLGLGACLLVLGISGVVWLAARRRRANDWRAVMRLPPKDSDAMDLAGVRSGQAAVADGPVLQAPASADGRLAGKYEIIRMIGRGGMGEVYIATDHSLGRQVAIKKMSESLLTVAPQAKEMFIKEAKTVAAVHHPAIVDIYEIFADRDSLYLVFEYVRGRTVQQLLLEKRRLSMEHAASILKPVCQALEFAHNKGLVHRDLKPSNIMVMDEGLIKLLDFGIARSLRDGKSSTLTDGTRPPLPAEHFARTGTVVGTPQYMAPEMEQGIVCRESDIYSLGVCLYEMLTGCPVFQYDVTAMQKVEMAFEPASKRAADLPAGVDELIVRALQPSPQLRLKTAREFVQKLDALVGLARVR